MMKSNLELAVDNTKPEEAIVRRARPDEMRDVYLLLAEKMYPETGAVEANFAKGAAHVQYVFETGYVFVATKGDKIIGTIGLLCGEPFWYSSTRALYDRWLFIDPEHRSYGVMSKLEEAAIAFSEESGVPLLQAIFATTDAERKDLIMLRKKMKYMGGIFMAGFE